MGGGLAGPELAVAVAAAAGWAHWFGLSWPAPHRVIPNAATARWCHADGTAPTVDMPASAVDRAACYAGQTALRMNSVTSARQAVADLSPGGH